MDSDGVHLIVQLWMQWNGLATIGIISHSNQKVTLSGMLAECLLWPELVESMDQVGSRPRPDPMGGIAYPRA